MSYKVLIVEDDPQIAESLSDIVEILDHTVIDIVDNYQDAVDRFKKCTIDLALLDIQLKGVKSGIDIAEQIRANFKVPFIFTTAYADKATIKKASEHSPYGYIVKPYGMKDIDAGIEVAMHNHRTFGASSSEEEVHEQGVFNSESLFIKANSRIVRINIVDILYIEAKGDYALFKTKDKGYIVHTTFKNVEAKLNSSVFVKVHRSYIVNTNKIVDIEENNLLIENQVIPISRGQKPVLLGKLNAL